MNLKQLNSYLKNINEIEQIQLREQKNINDLNLSFNQLRVPKILKEDFFKDGSIFVSKHHRFSYMPSHTHDFIEINYMHSGECIQYINEVPITLKAGQLLLMDKDIVQRIDYVGENDILINILLQDDSLSTDIINNLAKSQSIVSEFLLNASNKERDHNNFLFFDSAKNDKLQALIQNLMVEAFSTDRHRNQSLKLYMSLIFIELMKLMELQTHTDGDADNYQIFELVKYIEDHFTTITLEQLAHHFGYNKNYLSNKLKKKVGKTFLELVTIIRMKIAYDLVRESNYSMEEIAYQVGYENPSYFYKIFKKTYQVTPLQLRKKQK